MKQSRKNEIRTLYEKIDELDDLQAKAGSKSERKKIERRIIALRQEVAEILDEEAKNTPNGLSPRPASEGNTNSQDYREYHSRQATTRPINIRTSPDKPKQQGKTRPPSTRIRREHNDSKPTAKPIAKPSKNRDSKNKNLIPRRISRAKVADYIYHRLSELEKIILSDRGKKREKAKTERALLDEQFKILYGDKRWEKKLDSSLVEKVYETPPKPSFPKTNKNPNAQPAKAPDQSIGKPTYLRKCRKMNFRQLREFIDESLRQFLELTSENDAPSSHEEFLDLWEMLCRKTKEHELPPVLPDPGAPPELPEFVPSEQLKQKLEFLNEQRRQLTERLAAAGKGGVVRKLRHRLHVLDRDIVSLEKRENHEEHHKAQLRQYHDAKRAHLQSVQQREVEKKRQRKLRPRRLEIADRVLNDIERAFKLGATGPMTRLPWRLLPPGELSVQKVLQHYNKLEYHYPDIRYEKERISKAFSLGPNGCFVGTDEYEGYIVFTFAHTSRVLMECPVFGNAIYILNSDWKRLSRLSKQDLLLRPDTVKIVHKGDWFLRVKRELTMRKRR